MSPIHFRLFVAGQTPRSTRAIANLRTVLARLGAPHELEVVDVVEAPEEAERWRILTTPTLIKETPPPSRRVTGDLSNTTAVLYGLALEPNPRDGAVEDQA